MGGWTTRYGAQNLHDSCLRLCLQYGLRVWITHAKGGTYETRERAWWERRIADVNPTTMPLQVQALLPQAYQYMYDMINGTIGFLPKEIRQFIEHKGVEWALVSGWPISFHVAKATPCMVIFILMTGPDYQCDEASYTFSLLWLDAWCGKGCRCKWLMTSRKPAFWTHIFTTLFTGKLYRLVPYYNASRVDQSTFVFW